MRKNSAVFGFSSSVEDALAKRSRRGARRGLAAREQRSHAQGHEVERAGVAHERERRGRSHEQRRQADRGGQDVAQAADRLVAERGAHRRGGRRAEAVREHGSILGLGEHLDDPRGWPRTPRGALRPAAVAPPTGRHAARRRSSPRRRRPRSPAMPPALPAPTSLRPAHSTAWTSTYLVVNHSGRLGRLRGRALVGRDRVALVVAPLAADQQVARREALQPEAGAAGQRDRRTCRAGCWPRCGAGRARRTRGRAPAGAPRA